MRVIDTEHDRELHAETDGEHYRLLEVSGDGERHSDSYDVAVPVKWQVGYLGAEEFESRLGGRYERPE